MSIETINHAFAQEHVMTGIQGDGIGPHISTLGRRVAAGDRMVVQVTGQFGEVPAVTIEGSMDQSNWFPLPSNHRDGMRFEAEGLRVSDLIPAFIRPNAPGSGGADLTVRIMIR